VQIPYQANKAALVEKIAELVNNKVEIHPAAPLFCDVCFLLSKSDQEALLKSALSLVMGVAFDKAS